MNETFSSVVARCQALEDVCNDQPIRDLFDQNIWLEWVPFKSHALYDGMYVQGRVKHLKGWQSECTVSLPDWDANPGAIYNLVRAQVEIAIMCVMDRSEK